MVSMVSVIYVNYNTSQLIIESVASLKVHCRQIPFEIIVVDNHSRMEEQHILRQWQQQQSGDGLQVLFSTENLGFGKANNLAVKHSNGKYLFFLNPDTLILNDVLSIFYNFLESADQKIAACGGNLLKPDGSLNDSYGNFPGFLQELCHMGLGIRFLFNSYYQKKVAIAVPVSNNEVMEVPYLVGADLFIRAECFKLVQGFDENYFLYYEETDLFKSLSRQGFKACIIPQARIVHFEGASVNAESPDFNYRKFEMLLKSKRYYYEKWIPFYLRPFIMMIVFLQTLTQYLKGSMGDNFPRLMNSYWKAN